MIHYAKGATLLEVLITVIILAIGLLGLAKFQGTISYREALATQYAEAANLAEQDIESLRDYEVINTTTGKKAYNDIASTTLTYTGMNAIYTIQRVVNTFTNPNYKRVDETVTWTDRTSSTNTVKMSSIIAQIDPSLSSNVSSSSSSLPYP